MGTEASRDLLLAVIQANHEIFMVTNERVEAALTRLQLTPQTAQTLWTIDPDAVPPSMSSIAATLHCNASNLTFIAKQLEARGYVTRERDAGDRRSHVLVLTSEGRRAREAAVEATLSITPFAECSDADLRELSRLLSGVSGQI
jgi:DNA-binding MarR family transcriptional regulator